MRIMGLDIGDKRIGLAVSDELGLTAQGLSTLVRTEPEKDIMILLAFFREWSVEKIVVGMPRNMNGTYGPQADKIKEFTKRLRQETAVQVVFWDERLSTAAAERTLLEGNVSRKKRKEKIDRVAATIILQGYLDSKR